MRDYIKIFWMAVTGLLVAVLIYPFVHESGHTIASILSGAEVLEFNLFPQPNILCNVSGVSNMAQVFMGLSGLILPAIISVFWYSRHFYIWYTGIILKGITLLSAVMSIVVTIMNVNGKTIENDDITQVLALWESGSVWILAGSILTSVIMCVLIFKDKPLQRIFSQFDYGETYQPQVDKNIITVNFRSIAPVRETGKIK